MTYPRFQQARAWKMQNKTTQVAFTTTSWAALDTAKDITLSAQVGDGLEIGGSGAWNNEAFASYLDAWTMVSGAGVNSFGQQGTVPANGAGTGIVPWLGVSGALTYPTGGSLYIVQAGDLSSGAVTVRIMARTGAAGTKNLNSLLWWIKNIGPADPH